MAGPNSVRHFWTLALISLKSMDSRPIGMFDSGVGGLSILLEVKKNMPRENFVFLADQAHIPYGSKTREQLKKLACDITNFLIKHDVKLLVVACNTASCYTIEYLREKFTIPIVGVVPAIKPAASIAKNSRIAILSTPATSKSIYLKKLIIKAAPQAKVLRLGCQGLEEAVEYFKTAKIAKLLDEYLKEVIDFGADVIVLGCTHYPFLKKDMAKIVGHNIKIIDSGKAIAKRVAIVLKKNKIYSSQKTVDRFFTTGDPSQFSKIASTLLKYKIDSQKALI